MRPTYERFRLSQQRRRDAVSLAWFWLGIVFLLLAQVLSSAIEAVR